LKPTRLLAALPSITFLAMRDADRFKLLGTYTTPRVRIGERLTCEARDCDVIVVGYSEGRIPWPIGRRPRLAAKALVVFGDLADAVRRESNQAVCYWFGVSAQTVSKWRKALGVGQSNDGTHKLRSAYTAEPWAVEARAKVHAKTGDPERRTKIAASKIGKPRPAHVIEAMRKGRTGKPRTVEPPCVRSGPVPPTGCCAKCSCPIRTGWKYSANSPGVRRRSHGGDERRQIAGEDEPSPHGTGAGCRCRALKPFERAELLTVVRQSRAPSPV
jgi:transposase-like protein